MNVELLLQRVLALALARVQRGDYTERGLARIIGISQPQVHNLLKGKRRLQPALADRILMVFGMDILDLLDEHELRLRLAAGPLALEALGVDASLLRKGPGKAKSKNPLPEDALG